jgi:hypothetical protein
VEQGKNTVTNRYERELNYYIESERHPYGLRLKNSLGIAIDQAILEQGSGQSKAAFIEQAIIQRLGGVPKVTELISRYIERLNRREREKDALNPKLWSINDSFQLVQDAGATY